MLHSLLLALVALAVTSARRGGHAGAARPHLVTLLADDLGWYDTTINNPDAPTPQISWLLQEGLRLDRHYVYRYCSPTRRSMLSGRWPAHITGQQAPPCSNFLPLSCTLLSEKLKLANYSSHFVGKGHLGYQVRLLHMVTIYVEVYSCSLICACAPSLAGPRVKTHA